MEKELCNCLGCVQDQHISTESIVLLFTEMNIQTSLLLQLLKLLKIIFDSVSQTVMVFNQLKY